MARKTQIAAPPPVDRINVPQVASGAALSLGSLGGRALAWAEHADFLVTMAGTQFQFAFYNWSAWIWLVFAAIGLIFVVKGLQKRPQEAKPLTWLTVGSFSLTAFILGCVITIPSTSSFPRVLLSNNIDGECAGTVDGQKLEMFADKYKVAIACVVLDPKIDPLRNNNVVVSEEFSITPEPITIDSGQKIAPSVNGIPIGQPIPAGQSVLAVNDSKKTKRLNIMLKAEVGTFVILLPNDVSKDKIKTLLQVQQLNGKIVDSRYFK